MNIKKSLLTSILVSTLVFNITPALALTPEASLLYQEVNIEPFWIQHHQEHQEHGQL